ncbi:kinesin-like protein KIN-14B [Mangifera indica]|uniref:kinesin-like protein KIN-14B n=1 Tax=Mangifera indica TaxID=29780 RepID=UPI001CFA05A6|nr:kinesin-like protein KIN-14B [Mangifera indica]
MAENKSRWNWDVSGFEPRKTPSSSSPSSTSPLDHLEDQRPAVAPLVRRYSISATSVSPHSPEMSKQALATKLQRLKDKVKVAKEDYLALRQEASDLQEYSNAKLDRVTRYLGVLAEKTCKLDQVAIETEARISPLINEKKRLFNDLLTSKGNIKVFCRTRPLFEDEGHSVIEFPDDCTIRVNTGDDSISNPKKDFEFDRVYGPHVGQAELFSDVQPLVQSALDGYNVSIFAYGQTHSGKTHTMEGSSHDRGLYSRCFEELFDLSNLDSTSTSRYKFSVTVFELYNEQIRDLLSESGGSLAMIRLGTAESFIKVVQEKVDNPLEFSKVLKSAFQSRGNDVLKFNVSHLIIMIHIYYNNLITGESTYSKLSLVDLAGSEGLITEDDSGERVTDLLHVMKSLSALGDVLSSLSSRKDIVPYENSMLTKVLADSLGGNSKTLMIVNVCPNSVNLSETLASLNFSARARNAVLSLGNRDTIKKWRDVANDTRKELYEREKEIQDHKQEIVGLRQSLKEANDQCILLYNEVQKAWKVSFTLQSDLKSENYMLSEKHKIEKEQNAQLRNQVARLLQLEQEQKMQIQERDYTIQTLQAKIKKIESQLNEALHSREVGLTPGSAPGSAPGPAVSSISKATEDGMDSSAVTKKLEEELKKRDALIERLHEENEKLFDRLTEKASVVGSPQVSSPLSKGLVNVHSRNLAHNDSSNKGRSMDAVSSPLSSEKTESTMALVKSTSEKVKTTPAGEYLTTALNDFDPEQFDSLATISDGANKLLMLVLAAVIKAGASREHEILAEIRDAVFSFIRKMEPKRVMDTMLVSRVRILYIRSLLARSPELQSIKVSPVECFLEKANTGRSRSSSRSSSPGRSPVRYVDEQIQGFKVNIKPEKKSKLSSVVLRMRGIDQDTWRQQVTGGKLRELQEEAKSFAIGNKVLAALFVHTPAGELQRQIRSWLAENFEFLSVTGDDTSGGATGQLELLSTAIMDGWMAGLGAALPPNTDALGQLLSEYAKRVYNSQLQHLKDIAGTLASEEAEDGSQVAKLRSALESVDHKRRKILQQMRSDTAFLMLEDGGSPVRSPNTAAEDARLASLISLDAIMKQLKDIMRQSLVSTLSRSKKKAMLSSLDELAERMPSLLAIDHPCAQRQIADTRRVVESIPEEDDSVLEASNASKPSAEIGSGAETDVAQWNVLQFNTGSTNPFIIKCGANSNSELVIKADSHIQEPKGGEIVRVVPRPSILENMSLEDMKQVFSQLPEALSLLALARTADGTRARYSRLYRTLAMKVPALRDLVGELEKGGVLKDVKS